VCASALEEDKIPFRKWLFWKRRHGILRKGSFTVELACLMPVFLLVIFALIALCFYQHNQVWLTAAAREAAQTGCAQMGKKDGDPKEAATEKCELFLNQGFYGAEDLRYQIQQEGKKIKVSFRGKTNSAYGKIGWQIQAEAESKYIDPVTYIWKIKGLEGIKEKLKGEE
jgi:hypothetical protein